jgi:IS30 family transposase
MVKDKIYEKVNDHTELKRLDYKKIKEMKSEGFNIAEIARKMGKNKSSIHYVFHKV